MIIVQIKDSDSVKHIIQHIEKVIFVEYQGNDEILYLTEDKPGEIQSVQLIPGCRISIK